MSTLPDHILFMWQYVADCVFWLRYTTLCWLNSIANMLVKLYAGLKRYILIDSSCTRLHLVCLSKAHCACRTARKICQRDCHSNIDFKWKKKPVCMLPWHSQFLNMYLVTVPLCHHKFCVVQYSFSFVTSTWKHLAEWLGWWTHDQRVRYSVLVTSYV